MIEEYCGWARDVDWGNAPSWIAVLIAATVGSFTVIGVRVARKSYTDKVWQDKIRPARTVFAHLEYESTRSAYIPFAGFVRADIDNDLGPDWALIMEPAEIDVVSAVGSTTFGIRVSNNGDEPVRIDSIALSQHGTIRHIVASHQILYPSSTKKYAFYFRGMIEESDYSYSVTLTFQDSAGVTWSREDVATPVELNSGDLASHNSLLRTFDENRRRRAQEQQRARIEAEE